MKPHCVTPTEAVCAGILPGYDFADTYAMPAPSGLDAPAATRRAFGRSPGWIKALMASRNRLGALAGLKPAPASGFPVIRQSPDEVLLGFDDWHLDFRILVSATGGRVALTTIVRCHNLWGRIYLRLIMPFHRIIAPRMLAGIV